MTSQRPPRIDVNYDNLPSDGTERHEKLVEIFGQYLFWLRNWSTSATRELGESEEGRANLGTIRRKKYDRLAQLDSAQRDVACKISEATVDRFMQLLLTLLSGRGTDQRLGDDHAINFKLVVEICDVESGKVVEQHTISRGGKKFFAQYWGRWLNQFGKTP